MNNPIVQELIKKELDTLEWNIEYHQNKLSEALARRDMLLEASNPIEG